MSAYDGGVAAANTNLIQTHPSFSRRWEKPHMLYGQLLDWIRYMVAWMPVILCIVQMFNMFLGLE